MTTSIFVGNIPYGALEAEIEALFQEHGEVIDIHFCMDHTRGRFRGFGFVTMPKDSAKQAIEALNGTKFQDRNLKVCEAQAPMDD